MLLYRGIYSKKKQWIQRDITSRCYFADLGLKSFGDFFGTIKG